jgi:phosphatidylserine decarboxylase
MLTALALAGVQTKNVQQLFETLSVKQGRKYNDPKSARSILPFIHFHNLDVSEIAEPLSSFTTFNQFFYRKLKPGARRPASDDPVRPRTYQEEGPHTHAYTETHIHHACCI